MPSLCACASFVVLVLAGVAAPANYPNRFFGVFSYVHAIKIFTWDFAGTTQAIQRITGIPIYSASVGILVVGGGAIWKGLNLVLGTCLDSSLPVFCQQSTSLVAAE